MGILSQSNSVDKARDMFELNFLFRASPKFGSFGLNGLVIVLGTVNLTFNLYYNYPIITIIQVIQL